MKFVSVIIPFAYFSLATSLSFFGNDQATLNDGNTALKVPGENPLTFCADPKDYLLDIDYADLTPNPPAAGQNLTISASGTFAKDVEEGTKVLLQVKYGLITLIKQEADLCDQIGNVDLSCPLKKGPMTLIKDVAIPKEVPKGKYTVMADVYTEAGEKKLEREAKVRKPRASRERKPSRQRSKREKRPKPEKKERFRSRRKGKGKEL